MIDGRWFYKTYTVNFRYIKLIDRIFRYNFLYIEIVINISIFILALYADTFYIAFKKSIYFAVFLI